MERGKTMSNNPFWTTIRQQVSELKEAKSADDVVHTLSHDRNPYGSGTGCEDGFFAGSGGEESVYEVLTGNGWREVWAESGIYYTLEAPDGSRITYIEGDIRKGDRR
jgi:hypothetical protein